MIQSDRRPDTTGPPSSAVAEVSFTSACNGSAYAGAERSLLGLPGVTAAHFDRTRGVAHVTYDRSDGKVSQRLCDSFCLQGMEAVLKAAYDCIKGFSETDNTADLKSFDVPTLIVHGKDDQIVSVGASPLLSSTELLAFFQV